MDDKRMDSVERLMETAGTEWREESRPSTDFRRRLAQRLHEEQRREAGEPVPASVVEVASPRRRAMPRWLRVAAVLLVCAIPAAWLLLRGGREEALLVYRTGTVLAAGQELREGESISTGGDGRAIARLDDGRVELLLAQESDLRLVGEDRVHLDRGDLWVMVRPQSGSFEVTTPNARITVKGTKFGVHQDASGTLVQLESGVVTVEAAGAASTLEPGARASVLPGAAPAVVKAESALAPDWARLLLEEYYQSAAAQRYPTGWTSKGE